MFTPEELEEMRRYDEELDALDDEEFHDAVSDRLERQAAKEALDPETALKKKKEKEYNRAWRERNQEKVKENLRRRDHEAYQKRLEDGTSKAYNHAVYLKYREQKLAYQREYHRKHYIPSPRKTEVDPAEHQRYMDYREYHIAKAKRYYRAHREEILLRLKQKREQAKKEGKENEQRQNNEPQRA